ncbi:MAG: extracellular solute-binding protein [Clostridia bacterium]
MLKKTITILILLAMVFSMVACSSPAAETPAATTTETAVEVAPEPSTLNIFYYQETMKAGMDKIAEAFMAENPSITVTNELVTADHAVVLKSKDAAGQLPEIFVTGSYGEKALKSYIDAGKIVDVSNLKVVKQLPQNIQDGLKFADGKIYNVPFTSTAMGTIYSKKLFAKAGITTPPTTFDELKVAVDKLKAVGATPFVVAAKDGWPVGSQIWEPLFQMVTPNAWNTDMWAGKESFGTNSKPIFDFISYVKANADPKGMETDFMTSVAMYTEGNVGMMFYSPNMYSVIAGVDQAAADDTGFFSIPMSNNAAENKVLNFASTMFQISSKANMESVDKYFDFIINGNGKNIYISDIKQPNLYGITYEADAIQKDADALMANGNFNVDYQMVNEPDGFWQVISTVTQEYYAGIKTYDQAIAALDKGWKDIGTAK